MALADSGADERAHEMTVPRCGDGTNGAASTESDDDIGGTGGGGVLDDVMNEGGVRRLANVASWQASAVAASEQARTTGAIGVPRLVLSAGAAANWTARKASHVGIGTDNGRNVAASALSGSEA